MPVWRGIPFTHDRQIQLVVIVADIAVIINKCLHKQARKQV